MAKINSTIEQMLVVAPSWIGDMVMAQSLFMLLKSAHPQAELTVLAPAWSKPLLQRMPEVDHELDLSFGHGELSLWARRQFALALPRKYDLAVVLPNTFKSALIPFFAGIPRRVGWRGECRNLLLTDCRQLDRENFPRMVQRFVALGVPASPLPPAQISVPRLRTDPEQARFSVELLQLQALEKTVVICPGAEFGEAKQWPAAHYAQLCERLIESAWQVWIMGSANDNEVAGQIVSALPSEHQRLCHNMAGKTTLDQAVDLLSLATVVVSNDSGLMHIAAALNKPVVALYGSTSPDFTPPLVDRVKLLSTKIECRPCFQRKCPLVHLRCLTEISPQRVFDELQNLLAQGT